MRQGVECPACGHVISYKTVARALAAKGGRKAAGKGGTSYQASLSPEERSERARAAARKRWGPPKE